MTDTPIPARPKGVRQIIADAQSVTELHPEPAKRPVGRPPKPETADPFTVLTLIASALRTVDKQQRKQILETLLGLSE